MIQGDSREERRVDTAKLMRIVVEFLLAGYIIA
jgi:hypothetical protein